MARITLITYGRGHRTQPDAHLAYDLRPFRNPLHTPTLAQLTGRDRAVRHHFTNTPGTRTFLRTATQQIHHYPATAVTVAFGCTGGRHRSVAAAYLIARRLRRRGHTVNIRHLDIHQPLIQPATAA
jgi:RNase adaptor protein for sRNA GlmZ degradation